MTRKKSLTTIIILTVILAILLAGCSNVFCTVTLHLYDDVVETQSVFSGSSSYIKTPTREGYNFDGWFYDSELTSPYSAGDSITSDISLYAKWSLAEITVNFHISANNVVEHTGAYGSDLIETPELTGYYFLGWYTDADFVTAYDSTTLTKSMDLYAKWEKLVTYKLFINGEFYKKGYTRIGTSIILEDFEDFVVTDNQWYTDNNYTKPFDINYVFTDTDTQKEVDLYARATAVNVKINVASSDTTLGTVSGGGTFATGMQVTVVASILSQSTANDGEVRFLGWFSNDTLVCDTLSYTFTTNVMPLTLTAKFVWVNAYTVTIINENNSYGVVDGGGRYFEGDSVTITATPATDYSFIGWFSGKNLVSTQSSYSFIISRSVTIESRFASSETTLIFDLDGGSSDFDSYVSGKIGDTVNLSTYNPTKEGFTFGGWLLNNTVVDTVTLTATNVVKAKWIYGSAGFNFDTIGGKVTATSYTGTDLFVKIPMTNSVGQTVTTIGSRVFDSQITDILGVEIPETITTIKEFAFSSNQTTVNNNQNIYVGMLGISYFYIPATVTSIEPNAFHGCVSLSSIEFGGDLSDFSMMVLNYTPYNSMLFYADENSRIATVLKEYGKKNNSSIMLNEQVSLKTDQAFVRNLGGHYTTSLYNRNFAVDNLPIYPNTIKTTEGLLYVLRQGYLPMYFENDCAALKVWNKARNILSSIIYDSMTDFEKAHMIYDYVIGSITYDNVYINSKDLTNKNLYRVHFLEGAILDNIAVCDGYSKAFELLCRIEGIYAITVYGTAGADNQGHAWNKVYIDSDWRFVDATWGDRSIENENYDLLMHDYFLVEEQSSHTGFGTSPNCVNYNYYANNVNKQGNFDYEINSRDELVHCVEYYKTNIYPYDKTLEIKLVTVSIFTVNSIFSTYNLNIDKNYTINSSTYTFVFK